MSFLRNPVTWGAAALTVVTVIALVVGYLYVSPPGQKTVTFYTDDAASIRPGDEVRIAGITVGRVDRLTLEPDKVRVQSRVEHDAFVGNQSQIQIRMLTVVGGYYVNLVSLGRQPLGDEPIPVERVITPYSLIRTLTDATKITQEVDPKPINESLSQIQNGLKGTNTETLSAVVDAGNSLMSTIDRQRGQVTSILNMTDEYVAALARSRDLLTQLVRKLSILEQTLALYSKGFGAALDGMGDIMAGLLPVGIFWKEHRDDFLERVRNFLHKGRLWVERNGLTVRLLRRIQQRFERVLDAQNAPPELLATDFCVPVPGNPC